ncbi:DUF1385 domain-containing protein [Natroniella sulfidigena]|uniref:DUF1385 domain-containing protein n=1 Tax=Natroniella sulfidigena TaxID=723921 RepID=UPI00200A474E|nr:DUF1385 domain-containing protein [Natroniella sulfidigena]MCK8817292.1 DUF1385 domain-containing protein [Natroniella sulfidigena]
MKIGGRAYKNGVRLFGKRYSVKAYYENNRLKYTISKNKIADNKLFLFLKKIPFLRGIVSIIFALIAFFKEASGSPKKFWPVILLVFLEIGLQVQYRFFPTQSAQLFGFFARFNLLTYLILVGGILIVLRMTILKEIFKFHGAEHKAVNYYQGDSQGELTGYSRLARRCGTNLVVFYLIIVTSFERLGLSFNAYLMSLVAIGIAYEILLIAPKVILYLPYLVQKFTTIEPDSKHLIAAQKALEVLLRVESKEQERPIA